MLSFCEIRKIFLNCSWIVSKSSVFFSSGGTDHLLLPLEENSRGCRHESLSTAAPTTVLAQSKDSLCCSSCNPVAKLFRWALHVPQKFVSIFGFLYSCKWRPPWTWSFPLQWMRVLPARMTSTVKTVNRMWRAAAAVGQQVSACLYLWFIRFGSVLFYVFVKAFFTC